MGNLSIEVPAQSHQVEVNKFSFDPADLYKHVAIVDFTNAFST